jgi:DNA-binding response OmpR family regulator
MSEGTGSRKHVIVADDMPSTRALLRTYLAGKGFIVEEASTSMDVEDLVAGNPDSWVMLNLTMPPRRGSEYVKAVRSAMSAEAILVVYTADENEDVRAVMEAGADHFFKGHLHLSDVGKVLGV